MLEKLALAPLAFQSLICPNRSSDTILLAICAWGCGAVCGCVVTALVLSPSLRRFLLRAASLALQEAAPVVVETRPHSGAGVDRLQRYRQ